MSQPSAIRPPDASPPSGASLSPEFDVGTHWDDPDPREFRRVEALRREENLRARHSAGDRSHVFVSHSHRARHTQDHKRLLCSALSCRAMGAVYWADFLDLAEAGPTMWKEDVAQAIAGASKVVALIDAAFLGSHYCILELSLALSQGKTVVPVVIEGLASDLLTSADGPDRAWDKAAASDAAGELGRERYDEVWERLRSTNLCFCRPEDVRSLGLDPVLRRFRDAVEKDLVHMKLVATLAAQAGYWERRGRRSCDLLPPADAQYARSSLDAAGRPVPPGADGYVDASLAAARRNSRRRRAVVAGVGSVLAALAVAAVAFGVVASVKNGVAAAALASLQTQHRVTTALLMTRDLDVSTALVRRVVTKGLRIGAASVPGPALLAAHDAVLALGRLAYMDSDPTSEYIAGTRSSVLDAASGLLAVGDQFGRVSVRRAELPPGSFVYHSHPEAAVLSCEAEVADLAFHAGALVVGLKSGSAPWERPAPGACGPAPLAVTAGAAVTSVFSEALASSPSGARVAAGGTAGVAVGRLSGGALLEEEAARVGPLLGDDGVPFVVRGVAWAGEDTLCYGGTNKALVVRSLATGAEFSYPAGSDVNSVSSGPADPATGARQVVAACEDGLLLVALVPADPARTSVEEHRLDDELQGAVWTSGGRAAVVGTRTGVSVFRPGDPPSEWTTHPLQAGVEPIDLKVANDTLVVSTRQAHALLLTPFPGLGADGLQASALACPGDGRFRAADVSSSSGAVAAGTFGGALCLWPDPSSAPSWAVALAPPRSAIRSVAFDPAGLLLAVGRDTPAASATVYRLDAAGAAEAAALPVSASARFLAWDAAGDRLAVGLKDDSGEVVLWSPAEGGSVRVYGPSRCIALAWAPGGELAASFLDGTLLVADASGEVLSEGRPFGSDAVTAMRLGAGVAAAALAGGRVLAFPGGLGGLVGGEAGGVQVAKHADTVRAVHLSEGGRLVYAASEDGTISRSPWPGAGDPVSVRARCKWSALVDAGRVFCALNDDPSGTLQIEVAIFELETYVAALDRTLDRAVSEDDLAFLGIAGAAAAAVSPL